MKKGIWGIVILLAAMSLCGCENVEGKGAAPEVGTDGEARKTRMNKGRDSR